jgi:hypothetical protein
MIQRLHRLLRYRLLVRRISIYFSSFLNHYSIDLDEFYDDPSDLLLPNHDEITSNNNIQVTIQNFMLHRNNP